MACCPGSVAAYHEALSRLRHGFEFRPGRSSFTSITSSLVLQLSALVSDGFIRYLRTPLHIMSDSSEYVRNSKRLSRILRHRSDIPHDEHGWISIDDVEVHGGNGPRTRNGDLPDEHLLRDLRGRGEDPCVPRTHHRCRLWGSGRTSEAPLPRNISTGMGHDKGFRIHPVHEENGGTSFCIDRICKRCGRKEDQVRG